MFFKIITSKKQKELDKQAIRKLRFVAMVTADHFKNTKYLKASEYLKDRKFNMNRAENVFYANSVILPEDRTSKKT